MPALAPPPRQVVRSPSFTHGTRRKAVPAFNGPTPDLHVKEQRLEAGLAELGPSLADGDSGHSSSNNHGDSGLVHLDLNRDLPPLPPPSPLTSSHTAPPPTLPPSPHSPQPTNSSTTSSRLTTNPTTNQKVHYLRAARARGPSNGNLNAALVDGTVVSRTGSETETNHAKTSPVANSLASGSSDAGLDAEIVAIEGELRGLGSDAVRQQEDPERQSSNAITTSEAVEGSSGQGSKPADIVTIIKNVLPRKKDDDFSVDHIPDNMRLWEASQCRIKDERGNSRRFGDFWDDLKFRADVVTLRTATTPSMTRRSTVSTGLSEAVSTESSSERRESSATVDSVATISSVNGMTPTATETSGFRSDYGRRSPSFDSMILEDGPQAGPSALGAKRLSYLGERAEVKSSRPVTPLLLRQQSNASQNTIRRAGSKASSSSIRSEMKKIGGEEWIVMGRKTVVFWIRTFICGQCQDYTFASLSQLDPVAIHEAGINVIVIAPGSWKIIKRYREIFKCPFPIYVDDSRRLYQLMGMTKLSGDFGPAKGRAAYHQSTIPRQILKGIGNSLFKMPLANPGKISQLGGEFVLGPGLRCDFAHRMTTRSDHLEAPDVLQYAGCDGCTLPEQHAIELAQEEIEDLERMHLELEAWRNGRETELERIKRRKAERRGLRYEASIRSASSRLPVSKEEGIDSEGHFDDEHDNERHDEPPVLPLEEGLGGGTLLQLQSQINNVGIVPGPERTPSLHEGSQG